MAEYKVVGEEGAIVYVNGAEHTVGDVVVLEEAEAAEAVDAGTLQLVEGTQNRPEEEPEQPEPEAPEAEEVPVEGRVKSYRVIGAEPLEVRNSEGTTTYQPGDTVELTAGEANAYVTAGKLELWSTVAEGAPIPTKPAPGENQDGGDSEAA